MKGKFVTLCIFLLCPIFDGFCQTAKIRFLTRQLAEARDDQHKLEILLQLCEQRQSLSAEDLHKYAIAAKNISSFTNRNNERQLAEYYVANYYAKSGLRDSALSICQRNLYELQNQSGNEQILLKFLWLQAQVLVKDNQYKEGMAGYYKMLSVAEQSGDILMQMIAKNGVGWVYMEMDQSREGLRWFFRALQTSDNPLFHQKNANIYSNIASLYIAQNKNDSAEYFIKKAIDFARKDENLFYLANSLNILADNFISLKRPALAEAPLKEAIKIRQQIGDPFYIVSDLSQLAIFYAQQTKPEKGIAASLAGIEMARKYNLLSKLPYLQYALAKNYKAAGRYLQYGETLEKVLDLKDSVFQSNTEKELVEIRNKYNHQKQENLIMQQKLDINRKNSWLLLAAVFVAYGLIIILIVFKNYKRKQRTIIQAIKEEEKRKTQQAVRDAQELERRRISADLHDNLGAYASAISANADDLRNANDIISDSIINNIKSNADDIMNNLRETIWVLNKNEINLTSVSDRFKNYVARIRDAYPEISIHINENITHNTVLSPQSALNALRIMQEAFHNAIKHSKGDKITVDIASNNSKAQISIKDNGRGFSEQPAGAGNGISNMQQRARDNGWALQVRRAIPGGTIVELCWSVNTN